MRVSRPLFLSLPHSQLVNHDLQRVMTKDDGQASEDAAGKDREEGNDKDGNGSIWKEGAKEFPFLH